MRFEFDIGTALQVGGAVVAAVLAVAAVGARLDAQDRALAGLERDIGALERRLEAERAERVAAQARFEKLAQDQTANRAMWLLGGRASDQAELGRRRNRERAGDEQ